VTTSINRVQPHDLVEIRDRLMNAFGASIEGFLLSMEDDRGWTTSGAPVVMWENGPFSWTTQLPESVREYGDERGLLLEPVNTWCLAVTVA
jgi:hypothetical protein